MTDVPAGPPPTGPPSSESPPAVPPPVSSDESGPPALFWFHVVENLPVHKSDGSVIGQLHPGAWYPAHEEAGEWTSTTDDSRRSGWVDSAAVNRAAPATTTGQERPHPPPTAEPAAPPRPAAPPAPASPVATIVPATSKRHGCRRFFLTIIALLLIVGIGGFLLVRSGYVSLTSLQAQLSGVGSVTVLNITDDELQVRISGADEVTDRTTIEALDIDGFGALEPGPYTVVVEATNGLPPTLECVLNLERGQDFQFVAVPEGIAVTVGDSEQSADEVDASTSSLCGSSQ